MDLNWTFIGLKAKIDYSVFKTVLYTKNVIPHSYILGFICCGSIYNIL